MMQRIFLIVAMLIVSTAWAGPYSDQLRTDPPKTGRMISEAGNAVNMADEVLRSQINIPRGKYTGARLLTSYGERTTAGAETDLPIWPDGAAISLAPYGSGVTIQSTSANDTADGTGIQAVHLHYVRQDYSPVDDVIVELNGTTPVPINDPQFLFMQCMHIVPGRVGSGLKAAGHITAENAAGTSTYSEIATGKVRCSSSFRIVPKGMRLFVDVAAASSVSATADTTSLIRIVANSIEGHRYDDPFLLIPQASIGVQNNAVAAAFPGGIGPFTAGTIVGCTHTSNKAATVTCDLFGRLEPTE